MRQLMGQIRKKRIGNVRTILRCSARWRPCDPHRSSHSDDALLRIAFLVALAPVWSVAFFIVVFSAFLFVTAYVNSVTENAIGDVHQRYRLNHRP